MAYDRMNESNEVFQISVKITRVSSVSQHPAVERLKLRIEEDEKMHKFVRR